MPSCTPLKTSTTWMSDQLHGLVIINTAYMPPSLRTWAYPLLSPYLHWLIRQPTWGLTLYMMSPCVRLKVLDLDLCFQFKKKISPFIRTLTNPDPGGPSMFPSSLQDLLRSPSEPVNPDEIHTVCLCLCRPQAATKHCGLFIVHSLWPPLVVEVGAVTSDWGNTATSPKHPLLRKWEDEDRCGAHKSSQVEWPNIQSCWGLRLAVFCFSCWKSEKLMEPDY